MRLLIIEDEKRPREGLYRLIEKEFHGLTLLLPAVNGLEGLKLIEKEKPEIIITDIQMPDMNGIEMIKRISHKKYNPYIIVISGFSNFEYARESLTLGVKEYILKPFTFDSIVSILAKAIQIVRSSNYLSGIMNGTDDDSNQSGYLFLFKIGTNEDTVDLFSYLRRLILKQSVNSYSIDEYHDESKNIMAFFLSSTLVNTELSAPNIDEINHKIELSNRKNFVGVWMKTTKPDRDQFILKNLLHMHCFYDLPLLAGMDEYNQLKKEISGGRFPHQEERELIECLYRRDISKSRKTFLHWMEILIRQEESPIKIIEHLDKLIFSIFNILKKVSPSTFKIVSTHDYIQKLRKSLNRDEIVSLFFSLIDLFSIKEMEERVNNKLIHKVITHIKNHIHEPLTLEETAYRFQVCSEHLSRLFKEETGVGFNHFVNDSKIAIAKKELQIGEMKNHEIAELLSFSSPRYFAKVFKRITSCTPKEYKERI